MNEETRPATAPAAISVPVSPLALPAVVLTPPTPVTALTPEEQMALFEKELKENDWGHQPC